MSTLLKNLDVKNEGVWVWRVDTFRLVEIPKPSHGIFYSGDSYVILHTYRTDKGVKHRMYTWQGQESTSDEKASSAILAKKVNDEELGGTAEHVHQVQGSEDEDLKKLFGLNFKIKPGGVPSGFRNAAQAASLEQQTKLFVIKSPSRTSIQVVEVVPSLSSMMSNASFVLDAPDKKTLFVWHGEAANLREKSKSLEVANTFRTNRGAMRLTVLDQTDTDGDDASAFFQLLGEQDPAAAAASIQPSDQAPISVAAVAAAQQHGGSAAGLNAAGSAVPRLFMLACGKVPEEVPGLPSRSSLQSECQAGLVVNGRVWAWSGAKAPPTTHEQGVQVARVVGLPDTTPVNLVKEHLEPGIFMAHFHDWNDAQYAAFQAYQASRALPDCFGAAAASPKPQPHALQFDADEIARGMLKDAQAALKASNNGTAAKAASNEATDGKLTVWVVRGNNLVELPDKERGHFFDGDAYIVLYEYTLLGEERQTIYWWVGRHATNLERGTAAVLATEMYNSQFRGTSALCRIAQNSEPAHFAALFGTGALIIHAGERPERGGCLPDGARLYKLKAENAQSVHAVEVERLATSLNSGDCFVLKGPHVTEGGARGTIILWRGKGSAAEEVETASFVAKTFADAAAGAKVLDVAEGEEPAEFWTLIGGRAEYPRSCASSPARSPVLFHLRDTAGAGGVKVEASATFNQDCLCSTDAMLLDPGTGTELFVWAGKEASEFERPRAHLVADAYIRAQGLGQDVSIVDVQDGAEPPFFTQHFLAWDSTKRTTIPDVYMEKLKRQEEDVRAAHNN